MKNIISLLFLALSVIFYCCNKQDFTNISSPDNNGGVTDKESPDFVTFADAIFPNGWKTYSWEIDNRIGYDDKYSLRSANYPALVFANKTMEVPGYIEFYFYGDMIELFIDEIKVHEIASVPINNWERKIYVFEKGKHQFKWHAEGANNYIDGITFAPSKLAEITTNNVIDIKSTYAISGGNVIHNGNSMIICRGVCWNSSENPTIEDHKTINGTVTGNFISYLSGLTSNTTYYIRAYVTNWVGTAYGDQLCFKTLQK